MIRRCLVNNCTWVLQRHPHMLHGCCYGRPELWSLESSSSWAQWFSASCFQLPPLLISDFKITTRKWARMTQHRRQIALVSFRIFGCQFYKHATASPAAAIRQDRSTRTVSWRQRHFGGTRPACSQWPVSGLGHTEQKKLQGCGGEKVRNDVRAMWRPCQGN